MLEARHSLPVAKCYATSNNSHKKQQLGGGAGGRGRGRGRGIG